MVRVGLIYKERQNEGRLLTAAKVKDTLEIMKTFKMTVGWTYRKKGWRQSDTKSPEET